MIKNKMDFRLVNIAAKSPALSIAGFKFFIIKLGS